MPIPTRRALPIALTATLLAGCGLVPMAPPAAMAPAADPERALLGAKGPKQGTGALLVRFADHERFRLQYVAEDIGRLGLVIRDAAGATLFEQTYTGADVRARTGTVRVADLPAGTTVTAEVTAFTIAGLAIGDGTSAPVVVPAGGTAIASIALQLDDDPTPPPAATGAVAVQVDVVDGDTPPAPLPTPTSGTYEAGAATPPPVGASPTPPPPTTTFDVARHIYLREYFVRKGRTFAFKNIGSSTIYVMIVDEAGATVAARQGLTTGQTFTHAIATPGRYFVNLAEQWSESCGVFGSGTCYYYQTWTQPFLHVTE